MKAKEKSDLEFSPRQLFKINAIIDRRVKYKWTSKILRVRRGIYTQVKCVSIPQRPKEDAAKVTEYVLEQTGDGKEAPIRVKSCCCRPCGADMERKHQYKEMGWRIKYYENEAYKILNPEPSGRNTPDKSPRSPRLHKVKRTHSSTKSGDRLTLVERFQKSNSKGPEYQIKIQGQTVRNN
jgi:hypothetical protein